MKKNKHAGSSFESFLDAEAIYDEVAIRAAKKSFVSELEKALKESGKNKAFLRKKMKSPSTVERLFSDHTGVSLETITKAAQLLNRDLDIRFVKRRKKVA